MADDNSEKLLFEVEAVVKGQDQLIRLSETLVRMQTGQAATAQVAAAAQVKQAAATQQVAEATKQLNTAVAELPAQQVAIATTATAAGTAYLALNEIMRTVRQTMGTIIAGVQDILETGFDDQKNLARFTVLSGSAIEAQAHLESLKEFARTYNLEFSGVEQGSAVLQRLGITGSAALHAVASAWLVTGKSMEDIAARLGGVARGSLRGFLDLVPAASSALVKANAEIEAGAKKSPEAIRFLLQQAVSDLNTQFGTGLDTFANLTESKLTGVANRMEEFRERIFDAGVGDAFEGIVDEVTVQLDRLRTDGTMDAWAAAMGTAAEAGAGALRMVIGLAPLAVGALQFAVVTAGVIALGLAFTALVAITPQIIAFVALVGTSGLTGAVAAATVGTGALGAAVATLLSPLGLAAIAIGALTLGVNALADEFAKPMVLQIDADATLDEIYKEFDRLKAEKAALEGKKATVAGSIGGAPGIGIMANVVAPAINSMLFGRGETQNEVSQERLERQRVRTQGFVGPPAPAATAPKGDDDAAAKKAFSDAMQRAQRLLAEVERTEKAATDATVREVEARVSASGAEGAARLALFDQYAAEELAKLTANGSLRATMEQTLATTIAERRLVIERTMTGAIRDEQLKRLEDERQQGATAIALVFDNALAADDVRRALDDKRAKEQATADKKAADQRAKQIVDDAEFERDLFGQTTSQYIRELELRLAALKVHGAKTIAEQQAVEAALAEARQKQFDDSDRIVARGVEFERVGLSPEAANDAANTEASVAQAQQFLRDEEQATFLMRVQMLDEFAGIHGKAWEDMTEAERRAHAQNVANAGNTYRLMTTSARSAYKTIKDFVTDLRTNEQKQMEIARALTDKNAKMNVVAAAEQAEGELKAIALVAAVKALLALGEGLLGNPRGFAAAAAFAQSAALAGAGAMIAGGVARSVGESAADDRDREYARQNPEQAAAARGRPAARDVGLSVSQGNQPITMNFYNNVSFDGGAVFLGANAEAFVDAIIPSLQDAIKNGQLRFPGA